MDLNVVRKNLSDKAQSKLTDVFVHAALDSTNSEAVRLLESGGLGAMLIIADAQSSGRGRRGRTWESPAGSGLYMTLSYPFDNTDLQLQALSLVTAISVQQSLTELGFDNIELKWPNDLMAEKKKLAGILLEMRKSAAADYIIFGIGVNYSLNDELRAAIGRPVTDLKELSDLPQEEMQSREEIAARICSDLVLSIEKFLKEGFAPFQSTWNRLDRYFESDIVVDNGKQRMIGKSLGVDAEGVLQVMTAEGQQNIAAGEIFPSLRAADEASQ